MLTRHLPCQLNDLELRERSDRLAEELGKRDVLETEAKTSAKTYKERLEKLETDISELGRVIRNRTEYREIEVVTERNFDRRTLDVVRCDTGEVIDSRPLSPAEMQLEILPQPEREEDEEQRSEA